jgi:hypothetical protein
MRLMCSAEVGCDVKIALNGVRDLKGITERRGRVISTPDSYLGGRGFKSQP